MLSLVVWVPLVGSFFFYDALPGGRRRIYTIVGMTTTFIMFGVCEVALYYNWFQVEVVRINFGEVEFTSTALMSSGLSTLMIFSRKLLKGAILHPDEFAVLNVRLASRKLSSVKATLIQATYNMKMKEWFSTRVESSKQQKVAPS